MSAISDANDTRRMYELLQPYFPAYAITHDLGRGTAFPTTGYDGAATVSDDRFYRTDLDLDCFYDGTRWMTQAEYVMPLSYFATVSGASNDSLNIPIPGSLSLGGFYAIRATIISNVAAPNNGTNFYTFQVQGINTANSAADVLYTANTSADAAATYIAHEGITLNVPTNKTWVRTNAGKTGAPGALTYAISFAYRLIVP